MCLNAFVCVCLKLRRVCMCTIVPFRSRSTAHQTKQPQTKVPHYTDYLLAVDLTGQISISSSLSIERYIGIDRSISRSRVCVCVLCEESKQINAKHRNTENATSSIRLPISHHQLSHRLRGTAKDLFDFCFSRCSSLPLTTTHTHTLRYPLAWCSFGSLAS